MEVKLHDIGEGMSEADINCFFVKPGDKVRADEPLLEVQTDKMTAEIPAPRSGIIKEFKVAEGQTVAVGTTLLIMEELGIGDRYKDKVQKQRILASPFTRKIARENGIDLEKVQGSGPAGRITDDDIYRFIAAKQLPTKEIISTNIAENKTPSEISPSRNDIIPFRGRRKQIAKKMVQSSFTIPHCTHFEEVDVTELIQFRTELKKMNQNISATAFFLKALSVCLKEFPIFNARLDEDKEEIYLIKEHHFGIAVDTEEGLIVPVIRHIEKKSIQNIHHEMKELTEKALDNKLSVKEISGGTFTMSNVGPLGGSFGATPIIQHPEVALVSFHKTKKMPVVTDEDEIVIRSIMNISMSFDHRVADGATAVKFTNRFAQFIQNPKLLLLELV
ncbi:dihydrolipoamide acetyltransferase family protein [Cytobacillus dafuensis]|uniref:Dihydrolipoamide acetyltransferase component of pyruvate dehydrogenase complex n=1 Tax=Cytobacillus dafuensis TaxID=1742359 RepID=A0A5B8Z435_CYTDA|nr:dihydrolipoamide acetyltransferase family protein [Cytobacillus dafuensis]QED47691.1 2-oxo acid dehydrogenase subunit E2 [Cytobacillus dafuensis]